jgi:hypothetical protein
MSGVYLEALGIGINESKSYMLRFNNILSRASLGFESVDVILLGLATPDSDKKFKQQEPLVNL